MVSNPGTLYGAHVPSGFLYQPDFITHADEAALTDGVGRLEFSTFEMRGVVARRRVAFSGERTTLVTLSRRPCPRFSSHCAIGSQAGLVSIRRIS